MKISERFDRAIKALVKGYLNGTLAKGSCSCCAVGNIVADSCGYEHNGLLLWKNSPIFWTDVFMTSRGHQEINEYYYKGDAKKQIDSTGFSLHELARVEKAFESNTRIDVLSYSKFSIDKIDEDQLNGLYAVVDVLCEIEGITETEKYKEMFVKV